MFDGGNLVALTDDEVKGLHNMLLMLGSEPTTSTEPSSSYVSQDFAVDMEAIRYRRAWEEYVR